MTRNTTTRWRSDLNVVPNGIGQSELGKDSTAGIVAESKFQRFIGLILRVLSFARVPLSVDCKNQTLRVDETENMGLITLLTLAKRRKPVLGVKLRSEYGFASRIGWDRRNKIIKKRMDKLLHCS